MNSSGDITMCVVPSRHAVFSLSTTCPALLHCTRSSVLRRAGDVAAKLLQPLALVGAAAYRGVQAEALHIGTQRLGEGSVAGHGALHLEDLLHGARARGDSIPCGRRPQRFIAGRGHFDKHRLTVGAPVRAVEHQAVQVDVEVGGGTKSLDQRDRGAVGLVGLETGLPEQGARDHAVHHLQHGHHQLGLCGQHQAQGDGQ